MKNQLILLSILMVIASISFSCNLQSQNPQNVSDADQFVDSVMATMKLADKVGEMTQLTIDMLSKEGEEGSHELDSAKLEKVLVDHKVGSILNVSGHTYSRDHWWQVITSIQDYALTKKATGIPVLYGIDAIHGANYTVNATLFPQQIGQAATFNRGAVKKAAALTARDVRSCGIPWNFSPVLDLGVDPRWPRFWETFGEDVYVTKVMGQAMVDGYQGEDVSSDTNVAACLKHFVGYSAPISGKDRTVAWIPERQLREFFLPGFEEAIHAGAKTIMVCSGEMNGIPVHVDKRILTDLLRDELGFEGILVTDWDDIRYLYRRHKVAKDYKASIKMAINAGIDMSMVPLDLEFPVLLRELVQEGEVSMERIDESVRRILKVKYELGLFDDPYPSTDNVAELGSDADWRFSESIAAESLTLLKNQKAILPLEQGTNILLVGPTTHSIMALNGGWTHTWQGTDPTYNTAGVPTIFESMQGEFGASNITFVDAFDNGENRQRLLRQAGKSDVIVACLGEMPYTEKPGDIENLELPEAQQELIKELAESGKPIVLVMVQGRPRTMAAIAPLADAILYSYLPGDHGGKAIAKTLIGKYNPSGKLPFTYPRYPSSHTVYYHNHTDSLSPREGVKGFDPLFEFGMGLSYTTFEYSDLSMDGGQYGVDDTIRIQLKVKNTGDRDGHESVLLFVSDEVASITPAVKRLRAFQKRKINAGEEVLYNFRVPVSELAFVNEDMDWAIEPGKFTLHAGALQQSFTVK